MTSWITRTSKDDVPTERGWYMVMISGDSEAIDGFTIYSYPEYEQWAFWQPAEPHELEDFPGGYKGQFICKGEENTNDVMAYYGPFIIPPYTAP